MKKITHYCQSLLQAIPWKPFETKNYVAALCLRYIMEQKLVLVAYHNDIPQCSLYGGSCNKYW